jgi:predicted Zn-ribbon and HTH transcriptional regulator
MKELTENQKRLLTEVVQHFDKEDRSVRERQIRTWRRLKFFWEGFQRIYYSEVAHDWRTWDIQQQQDDDQTYYDKPVNVFRAYLESIIAALSVTVPPIKCYPDDADNTLDLLTAKAGDKVAQLIYRHNDVVFLWLHALFIYCTEGMVACYGYSKESEKFGTYEEKQTKDEETIQEYLKCPECSYEREKETDEFMPAACPECGYGDKPGEELGMNVEQRPLVVTKIVGVTKKAKSRQCLECYGGLYVKIPVYAKKQEDCPYLIFNYETHYALAREKYREIRDKISPSGPYEPYEKWGRLSPQYQGEYPINNVTIRSSWLRPAAFEILDEVDCDELKKLFPYGVRVVHVGDEFADAVPESLDDCWTLTTNPLADFIHSDPIGLLLVSLQEITNDLVSLTLQTIEHGIPQTFADPSVLNFEGYRQLEATPGSIYPATPKSGKTMQDSFYEIKTASLSGEVMPFIQQTQTFAQMVSGALPSLFGGQMEDNKTASGYSMSRAQALQRLQTTWKTFTIWWKQIFGKVIPAYIKDIAEDERLVERDEQGNFINTFIRIAELQGKIGSVELEANENLPMTWSQQRDLIVQLMEANNPQILATLAVPENLPLIKESLGLTEFYMPGEDDRNKQFDEIKQLLSSEPLVIPPNEMEIEATLAAGMMPEERKEPSVEVDPIFDNHAIQFEICRKWIISETGRLAKIENPDGYLNVLLHAQLHHQFMQQSLAMGEGAPQVAKPTELEREAPITGEENVQTA